MHSLPKVAELMSPQPQTIEANQTPAVGLHLMQELDVRHLPVLRAGRILGVVSQRDLQLAHSLQAQSKTQIHIEDLCSIDVYTVSPDTPLDTVLEHMEHQRIGSALVVEGGSLVGIFTLVDACRAYKDLLRSIKLQS